MLDKLSIDVVSNAVSVRMNAIILMFRSNVDSEFIYVQVDSLSFLLCGERRERVYSADGMSKFRVEFPRYYQGYKYMISYEQFSEFYANLLSLIDSCFSYSVGVK